MEGKNSGHSKQNISKSIQRIKVHGMFRKQSSQCVYSLNSQNSREEKEKKILKDFLEVGSTTVGKQLTQNEWAERSQICFYFVQLNQHFYEFKKNHSPQTFNFRLLGRNHGLYLEKYRKVFLGYYYNNSQNIRKAHSN